ncbi:DUF3575 domain-containing protein [Flavobacterium stagni]|uniref:DUF3575 domain-containing protein n=1 Tax=Flavobacterium stagni TaxID=2506421 RepID=A0A4Q1K916_9FLAO|nr:DUF3575 domain-containing protein [Flavobacterium stagni]RXR22923.1 DUF3575 domain-containing protein [Flavobacterium stagni]
MKKILLLCCTLLLTFEMAAQQNAPSGLESKKNELRVDVLQALAYGKIGLSYERFFEGSFSVGINANFSNSSKFEEDFNNGFRNNIPRYEFNPFVRYALSKSKARYYFAEIFGSANGGDYKEIIRESEGGVGYYTIKQSKYTDYALGGSLGYKMYIKNALAIEFLVGFGSNLTNKEKSPDVISRVGLNLGYRF